MVACSCLVLFDCKTFTPMYVIRRELPMIERNDLDGSFKVLDATVRRRWCGDGYGSYVQRLWRVSRVGSKQ